MKKILLGLMVSLNAVAGHVVDDQQNLIDLNDPSVNYYLNVDKPLVITQAHAFKSRRNGVIFASIHVTDKTQCLLYWKKRPASTGVPYILETGRYELGDFDRWTNNRSAGIYINHGDLQKLNCTRMSDSKSVNHGDLRKAFRGATIVEEPKAIVEPRAETAQNIQ